MAKIVAHEGPNFISPSELSRNSWKWQTNRHRGVIGSPCTPNHAYRKCQPRRRPDNFHCNLRGGELLRKAISQAP
jgi:hypothetical protein